MTDLVEKLPYVSCKDCRYFQIWSAGGCNRKNGDHLCMHKAFAWGGYGADLHIPPDKSFKTPDWCPLNEGVGYYQMKIEQIKGSHWFKIKEVEDVQNRIRELEQKIKELEAK